MKKKIYIPKKNIIKNKIIVLIDSSNKINIINQLINMNSHVILLDQNTSYLNYIKKNKYLHVYPLDSKKYNYNNLLILKNIIEKKFKYIDSIIFNSTKIGPICPIEKFPIFEWTDIINTNLNNTFLTIKLLLPLLKKSKNPTIIFTIYSKKSVSKAYWGAYACSNSGIITLMNILNDEYSNNYNIKINSICVDKIKTSNREQIYPYENTDKLYNINDIINNYIFLLDDKNNIKNKIIIPKKNIYL